MYLITKNYNRLGITVTSSTAFLIYTKNAVLLFMQSDCVLFLNVLNLWLFYVLYVNIKKWFLKKGVYL